MAGLLAIIALGLWLRPLGFESGFAHAQSPPMAGARGVFAFTGQIDHNRFGLFMLDVDEGTIWCYEIDSSGAARKLRLIAARTWIYDRYLQDFNCADPSFRQVQDLVAQQRQNAAQRARGNPDAAIDSPPAADSPAEALNARHDAQRTSPKP